MTDVRVYLDADIIIYLIEQDAQFAPASESWLLAHPCDIVSSELARMECLVLPVRNSDVAGIAEFENFFQARVVEMVPLDRPVFHRAIDIRAGSKIKTPDALNLAAAVEGRCDAFLTNDPQLRQYKGITVEVI